MVNRWASTQSWTAAVFLLISRSAHTAVRTTYSVSGTTVLTANQLRILEALQRLRIARTEGDLHEELVCTRRMDYLLDLEPK
ncbi:Uncharacterised protein [Mycobacteroides abscessus subsp. bolletii]|nr:Uncharacterised protein [Mycobacteroides abscessus subsp. bolletii]SLD36892.1 Uncharacterised protein [Mycobacteroides abscessus subsp. bolletii]